jgi:Ca2+-binding RTX toxin-like protein
VGGTAGNDVILFRRDPGNPAQAMVEVNSVIVFQAPVVAGDTFMLNGLAGADRIDVEDTFAGVPVTVNAGDGNDTMRISFIDGNLDTIDGNVILNGNGGSDTLSVWDDLVAFTDTYTITATTLSRPFAALMTYQTMEGVSLNAQSGNNIVHVQSTAAATPLTVNANGGNDTINVGTGNLDSLPGAVAVNGGAGTDNVNVQDHTANFSDTYSISSTLVDRNIFGGMNYATVEGLILNAQPGSNMFNISSTSASTSTMINAGNGNDIFNVGGGNMDAIDGTLTLNGQAGSDRVVMQDQASAVGHGYTITNLSTARTGAAMVNHGTIEGIEVNAGSSNDTVNGAAASLPLTLRGNGGIDFLTAGSGSDRLEGGAGNDVMTGGGGNDTYVFDTDLALGMDSINEAGGGIDTLDFSATTTRSVSVALFVAGPQFVNAGLTLSLLSGFTMENVIGGALGDTITGNTLSNSLTGGGGNDTLDGSMGNDRIEGGAGNDNLIGGAHNDTYVFDTDLALGSDTIFEAVGGGVDTLDFSPTTTRSIFVNLGLAGAQAVNAGLTLTLSSGITMENVIGGSLGDTMVGNALRNVLRGMAGNDTIFGLAGNDTLDGGTGVDTGHGGADADTFISIENLFDP